MQIIDIFHETNRSLSANKVRSGLTILGIVIGIGSVIAMISIGQGAAGTIQTSIEGLGSNLLTIVPGVVQPGRGFVSQGRGTAQTIKNADANSVLQIAGVSYVSPELQRRFQIVSDIGNNTNSNIIGATSQYALVRNTDVDSGTFLTDQNQSSMSRVAVIGPTVATDLFGDTDPLGRTIRINKINFKIIGILKAKGSSGFTNPDDTVLVPLSTMQKVLAGVDYLSTIGVSVGNKEDMDSVKNEAISILAANHKVDPLSPDFTVVSQADILGALTQITTTFTIFLAAVAGISLLVGGIGIMNMMLTTVTERTREIGLRKAIGAKKRDISIQFLVESIMLTFLGGVIGIILGWLLSLLVSKVANIATSISLSSVLLAVGVSTFIGIVFGYYPARRAASLNPIEALRYE